MYSINSNYRITATRFIRNMVCFRYTSTLNLLCISSQLLLVAIFVISKFDTVLYIV